MSLGVANGRISTYAPPRALFDASGLTALPGFIDIQINGAFSFDFTEDPASIWEVAARLPATGVTAFCPTIITSSFDHIARAQQALSQRPAGFVGAEPLGLHLEGPHLATAAAGAHPPHLLVEPRPWSGSFEHLAIVTLAPELPNALPLVRQLVAEGVTVSIGHTAASAAAQTSTGIDAGASLATHLFNTMPPIHHRTPGPVPIILNDPRAFFTLIVDGVHVAYPVVEMAWNAARPRFILATDAVACTGMPDGRYTIAGIPVTLSNGVVRSTPDTLAGSVLTMDQALINLMDATDADLDQAAFAASTAPAHALGLTDRGALRIGNRADITFLDDELTVVATVVEGVVVHNTQPDRLTLL